MGYSIYAIASPSRVQAQDLIQQLDSTAARITTSILPFFHIFYRLPQTQHSQTSKSKTEFFQASLKNGKSTDYRSHHLFSTRIRCAFRLIQAKSSTIPSSKPKMTTNWIPLPPGTLPPANLEDFAMPPSPETLTAPRGFARRSVGVQAVS